MNTELSAYKKLALMLCLSFAVMYAVMFLNVHEMGHIHLSATRLYMSLLMVTPMAIYMVLMMPSMYTNRRMNATVVVAALLVFGTSFLLLRLQVPVGDEQYMKAMIPHHSSAIMTSRNANLSAPEVKALAEKIIQSQEEEIKQMKTILDRLEKK